MARFLFSRLLVLVIVLSGIGGAAMSSPHPAGAASPHQVIIFVQGLTSTYDPSDPSDVPFLEYKYELTKNYGYHGPSDFIDFSYNLLSYKSSYQQAYAYGCGDTGQDIDLEAFNLTSLIDKYHQANPGSKIVLVGHSLGGQVITRALGEHMSDSDKSAISAVVTLDSPLYGVTATDLSVLPKSLPNPAGVLPCLVDLLANSQAVHEMSDDITGVHNAQLVARLNNGLGWVYSNGGRIGTFGNSKDCLLNHDLDGCLPTNPHGEDQTWSEVYANRNPVGASKMYSIPISSLGCSDLGIDCILDSHNYLKTHPDPTILNVIGQQGTGDGASAPANPPASSQPPASGGGSAPCTTPANPVVTSNLSVSPGFGTAGSTRFTASMTIKNTGCLTFSPLVLTVGGRGPGGDGDVQDFDQTHGIVVPAGQSYTYSAGRNFANPGPYNFFVVYMDSTQNWKKMAGAPGVATTASINLTAAPPAARPVVSSLTVSPAQPLLGQPVTVTYTITNVGGTDWGPIWPSIGVGGPGWPYIDFPDGPLTTVGKNNGQFTYSETKTFTSPGTFTFTPGY